MRNRAAGLSYSYWCWLPYRPAALDTKQLTHTTHPLPVSRTHAQRPPQLWEKSSQVKHCLSAGSRIAVPAAVTWPTSSRIGL
jgi:hypothetical protein